MADYDEDGKPVEEQDKQKPENNLTSAVENAPIIPLPIESRFNTALFAGVRYSNVRRAYEKYRKAIDEARNIAMSVANLAEAKVKLKVSLSTLAEVDDIVENEQKIRIAKREQRLFEQLAQTKQAQQMYESLEANKKPAKSEDDTFTAEDREFFGVISQADRLEAGKRKILAGVETIESELRKTGDLTPAQEKELQRLKQEAQERIELFREHVYKTRDS